MIQVGLASLLAGALAFSAVRAVLVEIFKSYGRSRQSIAGNVVFLMVFLLLAPLSRHELRPCVCCCCPGVGLFSLDDPAGVRCQVSRPGPKDCLMGCHAFFERSGTDMRLSVGDSPRR